MNPLKFFPNGTKFETVSVNEKEAIIRMTLPDDIDTDIWNLQDKIRKCAEMKAKLEAELREVSVVIMKLEEELDSKMKLRQG